MSNCQSERLDGRRILIVEDEFLIADEMATSLRSHGAEVVGPASTVSAALRLLAAEHINGAMLDINLSGNNVYPVADALRGQGIPFFFATGYDSHCVPARYSDVLCLEKPIALCDIAKAFRTHTVTPV